MKLAPLLASKPTPISAALPRLKPLAAVLLLAFVALSGASPVWAQAAPAASESSGHADGAGEAESVEFDATFLRTGPAQHVDVGRFSRGNAVSPGVYGVDILVNDLRVAREDVRFAAEPGSHTVQPCFTRKKLMELGVDFSKVSAAADAKSSVADNDDADECVNLAKLVPGAVASFDFGAQRLSLSVPQKFMRNTARGYVPPEMWEDGVNAAFLSYNANTYRTDGSGQNYNQSYLGLNMGVNVGGWHFRNQSSVNTGTGQKTQYTNIATYVQHDVTALKSQATLGDAYTTGDVFDSVSFRGVQLASDDRMLPESMRGYAPVVRGTATSNARVSIRQNGQVIYETSVSPGPFEITDLYATGYGGNLDVTVTEADGRVQKFTVPYASVAQSLRPGVTRYSATAGQLRDESLDSKPNFAQFTVQHGLTNLVTAYGGGAAANGYSALNVGAALNTDFGAFSADVTGAQTKVPGQENSNGASFRVGYSKLISPTDTNIAIAAYRHATPGYLSMSDAAALRDNVINGNDSAYRYRERNRLQLNVNQNMGKYGTVFVSAAARQYWDHSGNDISYQAGYSNDFKYGTYSVTAGRTRDAQGRNSNQVFVSASIPLGRKAQSPLLSTNLSRTDGATRAQANISGTAGEDNQYSYNAYGTYADSSSGSSAGVSGGYRGQLAQLSASASSGKNSNQMSAGIAGTIVVHPGGVSLSQAVGDTFGIVHAPGAEGASVRNAPGVKIGSDGYAVVPYMTPYSMNAIDIDPKGSSTDVEFESTSERAVPRLGSVAMVNYKTITGRAALVRAPLPNGEPLPFGVDVLDGNGRNVGVVAQDSRIFARGLEDSGALFVQWGSPADGGQCRIDYTLPKQQKSKTAFTTVQGQCLPVAAMPLPAAGGKAAALTGAE